MRISDWSSDVCSSDLENAVVFAVGFLDLVERLGDEESADAVARHEGKARLEEVEPPERRKLVEHHQELMLAPLRPVGVELLGQPQPDLVENEADERSEEHTSELQSLMRISYVVFCLIKKNT